MYGCHEKEGPFYLAFAVIATIAVACDKPKPSDLPRTLCGGDTQCETDYDWCTTQHSGVGSDGWLECMGKWKNKLTTESTDNPN